MRKRWIGCVSLLFGLPLLGLGLAIPSNTAGAATSPANLPLAHPRLVQIASGLTEPVALAWRVGDGGRVYVAEQT